MKKRVVITGLGTLNPVGNDVKTTWKGLLAGKNGIDTITRFDPSSSISKMAGEIKNFDPKEFLEKKILKRLDLYSVYTLVATDQAMKDANLVSEKTFSPNRAGCIMGCGIGGMETFEIEAQKLAIRGPRKTSPHFIPKMIINAAAANVAIAHNLKAANFTCSSACASGNHAMGTAFRTIQYGDADVIVTGGSEAGITPLGFAGFCSLRALSTRNDDPKTACRPFDKGRDGFVMGEGAAVLIFEELEHAQKRGAKIYAEVIGFGATCDAFHITAPAEGGEGGVRAIKNALNDASITPQEVQFFSSHGTSTPYNDKFETTAIKSVFGSHAKRLKINATKSMTGHLLGGAAAIEALVCAKTISTGKIHPTINQIEPDPECDLDYIPNKMIQMDVKIAVSNSLGFGGHNGVLVFKKYE